MRIRLKTAQQRRFIGKPGERQIARPVGTLRNQNRFHALATKGDRDHLAPHTVGFDIQAEITKFWLKDGRFYPGMGQFTIAMPGYQLL